MFLSKAFLKPSERGGTGALAAFLAGASAQIGQGHQLVWSLFGDRGGKRQFLYRMTGPTVASPILIASEEEPQDRHGLWTIVPKPLRLLDTVAAGDRVEWSVRVNATVSSRTDTGKSRSSRHCIVDRALRGGASGTSFEVASRVVPGWLEAHFVARGLEASAGDMVVQAYDKRRFGRGTTGRRDLVVIGMTDVVGKGTVRDAEAFCALLREGIGGGKAYGCGLVLARRAA